MTEYSYKDGYREGVIFLFYKDDRILIEHRFLEGGKEEIFIPNGSIEAKDHGGKRPYDEAALFREVSEEFAGKVDITKYRKLGEFRVEAPRLWFHSYVVSGWRGEMPDHTVEDGKPASRLEWVLFADYRKYLRFESALDACQKLQDRIAAYGLP